MAGMGAVSVQRENPGRLAEAIAADLGGLGRSGAVGRLWSRDTHLWPADEAGRREIAIRLGWLDSPEWLTAQAPEIADFGREVGEAAFQDVVLLGMGGSSLAPEVLAQTVGRGAGAPRFAVLDSTDPEAVARIQESVDLARTLFIVASKSGGTIETISHYRYFRERVDSVRPADASLSFVAITDEGSPLDRLASEEGFRKIFRNPPDIGGRYSALSFFGMVPAAIMGQDIDAYARSAVELAALARQPGVENPALRLGAFIGGAARSGADKLTILSCERLRPLGAWIEQLVAESTGKDGRGIVPIDGEPPGRVSDYGDDRCFVMLRLLGEEDDPELFELTGGLERTGHPVVDIALPHRSALAGEFLRWEVAVSLAGVVLGIHPFDQPNVQEAKDRTGAILSRRAAGGAGAPEPSSPRFLLDDRVEIHAGEATWARLGHPATAEAAIARLLGFAVPGEYIALLATIARSETRDGWMARVRRAWRDATRVPVLMGYGPRYLHSIGQLYKGGPPRGIFLQITHGGGPDLNIPQSEWSFGVLAAAQAQGDLEALESRGKPVLRCHLVGDVDRGLDRLADVLLDVAAAVRMPSR
jgi:glucose-6-phosphate isomerase